MVETLCAVLTGQKTGRENLGDDPNRRDDSEAQWVQWFLVMQMDAVVSAGAFEQGLGSMTDAMRAEPQAQDAEMPPMLPGDRAELIAADRGAQGVPLSPGDVVALSGLASAHGLQLPRNTASQARL